MDIVSRSDWANLPWKKAQHSVAKLLQDSGFMIFEEKRLVQSKRADIVVIKNQDHKVSLGIIEVKAYRKITPKMVQNSVKQACQYLKSWKSDIINPNRWGNKAREYFVAIVFTNDYPINLSGNIDSLVAKLFTKVFEEDNMPKVLISTPNSLIGKLHEMGIGSGIQSHLDGFF